jgi:hypothetical protein
MEREHATLNSEAKKSRGLDDFLILGPFVNRLLALIDMYVELGEAKYGKKSK